MKWSAARLLQNKINEKNPLRELLFFAGGIILAHNYPSGDPKPSEEDIAITKRLVESGKILEIEVLDHIVIWKNSFCSFKEKRLI